MQRYLAAFAATKLLIGAVVNHHSVHHPLYVLCRYLELEHVNDASSTFTAKITATTCLHTSSPPHFIALVGHTSL